MPEQRLVAVLISKPEEFAAQHAVFDNPPLDVRTASSPRQENLALFCRPGGPGL